MHFNYRFTRKNYHSSSRGQEKTKNEIPLDHTGVGQFTYSYSAGNQEWGNQRFRSDQNSAMPSGRRSPGIQNQGSGKLQTSSYDGTSSAAPSTTLPSSHTGQKQVRTIYSENRGHNIEGKAKQTALSTTGERQVSGITSSEHEKVQRNGRRTEGPVKIQQTDLSSLGNQRTFSSQTTDSGNRGIRGRGCRNEATGEAQQTDSSYIGDQRTSSSRTTANANTGVQAKGCDEGKRTSSSYAQSVSTGFFTGHEGGTISGTNTPTTRTSKLLIRGLESDQQIKTDASIQTNPVEQFVENSEIISKIGRSQFYTSADKTLDPGNRGKGQIPSDLEIADQATALVTLDAKSIKQFESMTHGRRDEARDSPKTNLLEELQHRKENQKVSETRQCSRPGCSKQYKGSTVQVQGNAGLSISGATRDRPNEKSAVKNAKPCWETKEQNTRVVRLVTRIIEPVHDPQNLQKGNEYTDPLNSQLTRQPVNYAGQMNLAPIVNVPNSSLSSTEDFQSYNNSGVSRVAQSTSSRRSQGDEQIFDERTPNAAENINEGQYGQIVVAHKDQERGAGITTGKVPIQQSEGNSYHDQRNRKQEFSIDNSEIDKILLKLDGLQREALEYQAQIRAFRGGQRHHYYIEENLTRILLKLDDYDVEYAEALSLKKREVIKYIYALLEWLEDKTTRLRLSLVPSSRV